MNSYIFEMIFQTCDALDPDSQQWYCCSEVYTLDKTMGI